MGYQTSLSIVFSTFRILLLELFLARRSSSTLFRSCMSSIGCQLRCELDLSYCCWSIQCVQQTAPTYLCELLHEKKKSKYGIRSYELEHLHIPDSETKTYGDRAFCFSGPREWNKLSLERRQSKSVEVFKTKLKSLLYKEYYKKKGVCG